MKDCWGVLYCIRSARLHDLNMFAVHSPARWLSNLAQICGLRVGCVDPWPLSMTKRFIRQRCLKTKSPFHAPIRLNLRQSTFAHMPVCKCQLCYLMTNPKLFLQSIWSYRCRMIMLLQWYSSALCVFFVHPIWRILTFTDSPSNYFVGWWYQDVCSGFGFWKAGLCAAD